MSALFLVWFLAGAVAGSFAFSYLLLFILRHPSHASEFLLRMQMKVLNSAGEASCAMCYRRFPRDADGAFSLLHLRGLPAMQIKLRRSAGHVVDFDVFGQEQIDALSDIFGAFEAAHRLTDGVRSRWSELTEEERTAFAAIITPPILNTLAENAHIIERFTCGNAATPFEDEAIRPAAQ